MLSAATWVKQREEESVGLNIRTSKIIQSEENKWKRMRKSEKSQCVVLITIKKTIGELLEFQKKKKKGKWQKTYLEK